MQMNWVSYLVNQLEQDCREAQDQGYEFHFSWLLILIAFIAWEMPEGVTFPEIESSEPLAAKFTTLWYSSDMEKQWKSNAVFHTYYLQLKRAIESFPRMMSNTLHRFRPLAKFTQIGISFTSLRVGMNTRKSSSPITNSQRRTWKK
jgi:hypothetical protein